MLIQIGEVIHPLRWVRGIFFGWWMSGVAALVMALGTVPLFQGMVVWNPVMRGHFGWSPAQLQWAFALTRVEGGIMGPIEGILVERLGSRRMVFLGLLVLGGGFVLFSRINELWHFYGVFFLMSLGAEMASSLPMMTMLNHWFVRRRTRAMALAMEGFAVGGIVLVPLIAWAIGGTAADEPDRFGWRATTAGIGVVTMLLALPISRLVRNKPEDYGYRPEGDSPTLSTETAGRPQSSTIPGDERGLTWQEAVRTRSFWLISFGHAASSVVFASVSVHLGLILDDRGFSLQTVGWVAATLTGTTAVFILIGGYIGDRVPIRYALFSFSTLPAVSVIVLLLGHSLPMTLFFAVLLGMGWGGRTSMISSVRGAYFGRRAFASITALSMVPLNIVLFAGPLFAGYMYKFTGSYSTAFTALAVVSALGCFLFLFLGEPRPHSTPPAPAGNTETE